MILGEELQGRGGGRGTQGLALPLCVRTCACVRLRPASGRGHFKVRLPGKRQRRREGSARSHQAENSAELGHAPGSSSQLLALDDNQLSPRQLSLQRAGQAGCGHLFRRSRGGRETGWGASADLPPLPLPSLPGQPPPSFLLSPLLPNSSGPGHSRGMPRPRAWR